MLWGDFHDLSVANFRDNSLIKLKMDENIPMWYEPMSPVWIWIAQQGIPSVVVLFGYKHRSTSFPPSFLCDSLLD